MKKTTKKPVRRVSITLPPDYSDLIDCFVQECRDGVFPAYKYNELTASRVVKLAIGRFLDDVKYSRSYLIEGEYASAAIERFWKSKYWWKHHSERHEIDPETPAEVISIREGMK
jgi:hypothetical protein